MNDELSREELLRRLAQVEAALEVALQRAAKAEAALMKHPRSNLTDTWVAPKVDPSGVVTWQEGDIQWRPTTIPMTLELAQAFAQEDARQSARMRTAEGRGCYLAEVVGELAIAQRAAVDLMRFYYEREGAKPVSAIQRARDWARNGPPRARRCRLAEEVTGG